MLGNTRNLILHVCYIGLHLQNVLFKSQTTNMSTISEVSDSDSNPLSRYFPFLTGIWQRREVPPLVFAFVLLHFSHVHSYC